MADADAILNRAPRSTATPADPDRVRHRRKPLSLFERLYNEAWLRKTVILLVLALRLGNLARAIMHNKLLLPTFTATLKALYDATVSGELLARLWAR